MKAAKQLRFALISAKMNQRIVTTAFASFTILTGITVAQFARPLPIPAERLLILTTASWLNRQQEDAIDYLREENRVLQEPLENKRNRFTDGQRRRLGVRGKKLGRKVLAGPAGIATPDTILRWCRRLITKKI